MKVLIIGAGIGGLTAALSLHKAGFDVHVYESAPEVKALGVGINILPHAVRVLTNLNLLDDLLCAGVATSELAYFNKFGQAIWQEPRGRFAGYNWPQLSIHRGALQILLLNAVKSALGGDKIHTGHHLLHCESGENQVSATFINKLTNEAIDKVNGDILIGADGIHSVVRRQFYPDEGIPKFSGIMLHRGTSMARPFLSGSTMIMAGSADKKFVAYPISNQLDENGNQLINWIADLKVESDTPLVRDWNRKADKCKLLAEFGAWKFDWLDVPGMIDKAEYIYEFPMSDRDPLPQWTFGRITLLGDAAHPMYPIGSNGASQAILDAEALAVSLRENRVLSACLMAYESVRMPATAKIILQNRQMGPEKVMQLVEERAPNGFANLNDVITHEELEQVAAEYKKIAGFAKEELNQKI